MAAIATRSKRERVSYDILHNLSSCDVLFPEIKRKKRSRGKNLGIYEAERLIASREDSEGKKFLVKWKGYSSFENTWEPEENLSPLLLRIFDSPRPEGDIVQSCIDRMRLTLLEALKHKGPEQKVCLEFRHDVFKYLFCGRGRAAPEKNWTLLEETDFNKCKLPNNWSHIFDIHGDGVMIRFPLKVRKYLTLSPKSHQKVGDKIVEVPRVYMEKISIKFVKVPSSCNNK